MVQKKAFIKLVGDTLKQPQREQTEIEIISIWLDVLDIINHDKYNKIFGYKKK